MENTNSHLTPLFGASPSPLRANAGAFLLSSTAILTLLLSTASSSLAGSATWSPTPGSGDWNTTANWTPATIPNGPSDTATFASSNTTAVSTSANTEVNAIVFQPGASAFTITVSPLTQLTISGAGITNNSGITQNFVNPGNSSEQAGLIHFINSATAGSGTVFTNDEGVFAGGVEFSGTSTAGNGTFINNASARPNHNPGTTVFVDTSTAGSATLIADSILNGGFGPGIVFEGDATGGTARIEVFRSDGALDIRSESPPGLTIGSIEGSGLVFLGANNLTVGSNNRSTTFSGMIFDGQGFAGGSLTKIGKGKLSLGKANTYDGGTTVKGGTLLVKNTKGSATGNGAVQVSTGTLGGTGQIGGPVTVGTGTSSGATLLAGTSATKPGTLTTLSLLTFNSMSTYKCVLNRTSGNAGQVVANGVTINSNVPFTFVDTGTGTLTAGTVFTVINSTSTTPIAGTFSNLPDGSTFTSNGNNFQVNYEGGTGNDLTLKVVP